VPLPKLAGEAHPGRWPYDERPGETWAIHDLFRGKTAGVRSFAAHTSILSPGCTTHPPHSHPGEEICLVLAGELAVNLPHDGISTQIRTGEAAYMPPNLVHGLTAGDELAVYHIIRWLSDPPPEPPRDRLGFTVLDTNAPGAGLSVPTDYLAELRCSVVALEAGAADGPRPAERDCMLAVLDGELVAQGVRIGLGATAAVPAGETLALSNQNAAAARFLLVELKPYSASPARRLVNELLWYSRRTPLRETVAEIEG
jgi:quercetin dioxygenase-like cupin family protein